VVADLLRGRIRPSTYLLLLRNLLPVYRALEDSLRRHARDPILAPFARPELWRAEALARDVAALAARVPSSTGLPLAAAQRYVQRIEQVERVDPGLLIAHAYVRHMGDLSGGQIVRRLLVGAPGIGPDAVRLYEFPEIADLEWAKSDYRAALDRAETRLADRAAVLEEACEAFRLTIALAEAVRRADGGPG
jgi:heme oxygenase